MTTMLAVTSIDGIVDNPILVEFIISYLHLHLEKLIQPQAGVGAGGLGGDSEEATCAPGGEVRERERPPSLR
jgi:hypothetical protein